MERFFDQLFFTKLVKRIRKTFISHQNLPDIDIQEIIPKLDGHIVRVVCDRVKYILRNNDPMFFINISGQYIVGDYFGGRWIYFRCEKEHYDDPVSYILTV